MKIRTHRVDYPSKHITISHFSRHPLASDKKYKENLQVVPLIRSHRLLDLRFTAISYENMRSLVCLVSKHQPNLEGLAINFIGKRQEYERLLPIIIELTKKLSKLRTLDLNFSNCQEINEEWLKTFAVHGVKSWGLLKSLSLDFSSCWTNLPLPVFADQPRVRMAKPSKGFQLARGEKVFNSTFELFIRNITRFMIGLRSLKLTFRDCKQLDLAGPQLEAFKMLERLNRLEELSLDFSECTKINNETLSFVGLQMSNIWGNLKKLALGFGGCSKITDHGTEALMSGIAINAKGLRSLKFNFESCNQITDEGIEICMGHIIGSLHGLQTLTLGFYRGRVISSLSVEGLLKAIAKGLVDLKKLRFHAGCNPRHQDDFLSMVSSVPMVTIL